MTLKHFIAPALLLMAFSFWYCQKSSQSELNSLTPTTVTSAERGEFTCPITDPGEDPTCTAQIRVRCISVPEGHSVNYWEVSGSWRTLENGMGNIFNFSLQGGILGAYQTGVWYDFPKPLIKQALLDANCPGAGNQMDCLVFTDNYNMVAQWSMWVDIKSGNRTTTYYMNGATGIMTPVSIFSIPNLDDAFDRTDVDFLNNCTNMGAQGVMCNPITGCVECSTSINDGHK